MSTSSGWDKMQTMLNYRGILESGIMVGRYLRWFEAGSQFGTTMREDINTNMKLF
jgi:hypothetical protein